MRAIQDPPGGVVPAAGEETESHPQVMGDVRHRENQTAFWEKPDETEWILDWAVRAHQVLGIV